MSNNNMINPANYYNPFAKYNYISKTRGVYFPRENLPVLIGNASTTEVSTNIYSENYDAEADLAKVMNEFPDNDLNGRLLSFLNKLFPENNSSEN